ncbi:hypothetical protein EJB05_50304, partial [Eragrostis curvula]
MAEVHQSVQAMSLAGAIPPEFVRSEQEQPGTTNSFCATGTVPEVPPVLDMAQPGCGARMADAATEWGFFQVVNHGVPAATIAELQRVGRAFFALPQEEKERYAATDPTSGRSEGYGVGTKASRNLEEGNKLWADFFYHYVAPAAMVNHHIWPKNPASYRYGHIPNVRNCFHESTCVLSSPAGDMIDSREVTEEYAGNMLRLTREMLEHLSVGLGVEKGALMESLAGGEDELVLLQKINSYPPCPQPDVILGIGPHTDMGTLTVLLPDEVPGLQICKDGRWHDVEYVPEELVIVSNGRYKPGMHRAMVNKEKTRMSWPLFVEPPPELVVGPHPQLLAAADNGLTKYKTKKYKDYQYCKLNKLPQ